MNKYDYYRCMYMYLYEMGFSLRTVDLPVVSDGAVSPGLARFVHSGIPGDLFN